jgi:predicted DNA-binding protein (UPF0251 family)
VLPTLHPRSVIAEYRVREVDPLALAEACGLSRDDVAGRVGVTPRRLRDLVKDARHRPRVRRAVLELALERERLGALLS